MALLSNLFISCMWFLFWLTRSSAAVLYYYTDLQNVFANSKMQIRQLLAILEARESDEASRVTCIIN